jgi:hypothetical protein
LSIRCGSGFDQKLFLAKCLGLGCLFPLQRTQLLFGAFEQAISGARRQKHGTSALDDDDDDP